MVFEKYKITSDRCVFVTDTLGHLREANAVTPLSEFVAPTTVTCAVKALILCAVPRATDQARTLLRFRAQKF